MTNVPTVKLNNGVEMPTLGFGVFQVPDLSQAEQAVTDALEVGYRLIDTAAVYQNEEAVGKAIKNSSVNREDVFVTSKLWVSDFNYKRAKAGIDASLQKLGLDYMDLYLLHQPYGDTMGAWRALQEAQKEGKIRAIGVSNFYADQLKDLELTMPVKPAVNQLKLTLGTNKTKKLSLRKVKIFVLKHGHHLRKVGMISFTNETIAETAAKYGKSNGQVILRWLLQRGITVIPKSVHKNRMEENIDVFDFELSDDDMKKMASLNKNESQFFDHRDPVTIEQIFGSSFKMVQDDEK